MLRVLIVEDSPERQKKLLSLFAGTRCTVVDSAETAIRHLREDVFDIVTLDYDLAGEAKGHDVAKILPGDSGELLVLVHSENPVGVERIRASWPECYPLPISRIHRGEPAYSQLKGAISSGSLAVSMRVAREVLG